MSLSISYMGTKRQLAPRVAELVASCSSGPILDVFSGMCSVASAVGTARNVWCNDAQFFASSVARAFFASGVFDVDSRALGDIAFEAYSRNRTELEQRYERAIATERAALTSPTTLSVTAAERLAPANGDESSVIRERARLARDRGVFPYRLSTLNYSGAYFSLAQSIQLDSLRYASDTLLATRRISRDQHRWMILAACQAAAKVATTTGHFAQPMAIKPSTVARYVAQRRRSIWLEWQNAMTCCVPVGDAAWRARNRVFRSDANGLIRRLQRNEERPAVVYADPPYTADQYSRYYHVYESLVRYDYPRSDGVGRYRADRFVSDFSRASRIADALERLICGTRRLGSSLVLSYPSKGLLPSSKKTILQLLRKSYKNVDVAIERHQLHSSFGASKGVEKTQATEIVYLASR